MAGFVDKKKKYTHSVLFAPIIRHDIPTSALEIKSKGPNALTHSSSSVWDPAEVTYGIRIINTGVEMDITYKQQTDKMNLLLIEAKHIIALEAKVRNALVK